MVFMRKGDPANIDLPPQPLAHATSCPDVARRGVVLVDQGCGVKRELCLVCYGTHPEDVQ